VFPSVGSADLSNEARALFMSSHPITGGGRLLFMATIVAAALAVAASAAQAGPARERLYPAPLVDRFGGGTIDRGLWRVWWGDVRTTRAGLVLASRSPTRLDETHSALVTTHRTWRDLSFEFTTTPLRQLRLNAPGNTWETSWVVFRFRDLANYYYFMVKPNGWELGKKHGSDAQIFLATGESPSLGIGATARMRIVARGARIQAWVDGVRILDFVDSKPLPGGAVGLYQEDAKVRFGLVRVGAA
jgi:hypothetical protein